MIDRTSVSACATRSIISSPYLEDMGDTVSQSLSSKVARYCTFNGFQDLFVVTSEDGFTIFKTDPFKLTAKREVLGGTIFVELLGRSNYLAFVSVAFPDRVQLWDDTKFKVVMEIDFQSLSPVKAIRLHKDALICVFTHEVRIYTLSISPQLVHRFETGDNPKGLIAVSGGPSLILSFPARKPGYIQFVEIGNLKILGPIRGQEQIPPRVVILCAHSSALACIAMAFDGSLVATASQNGTLVRVWHTKTGQQICELRRGIDKVDVQSIAFTMSHDKLAVVSDRGTVHIFNVPSENDAATIANTVSRFSSLAAFGVGTQYFGSSWSIAQARAIEDDVNQDDQGNWPIHFQIAWTQDRSFVVLDDRGGLRKFVVPDKSKLKAGSSRCQLESYRRWSSPR